ncbi:hypothetical protein LQ757_15615 [Agromyces sp. SYSU K20354]|uniref:DUF3800 domain-containing protein n=1 Tax=Agromyces cavernae TaxID=2898659 RepID=UPI001E494FF4|nr:DUF3800 domain-containing protein [Agromyces cavernae]MCD2443708.1 hypothetical protein [Agromyces cavernae]
MSAYTSGARVYVDECKSKGYYVAAAVVMPNDAAAIEKELRKLTRAGQRRIHFTSESDTSRRTILSAVEKLGLRVVVYRVQGAKDKEARTLCLNALIDDMAAGGATHVILERDESVEAADRRIVAQALRRNGNYDLRYQHASPSEHALLWVSDMVAWCCYKGGDWLRRASGIIIETRDLTP